MLPQKVQGGSTQSLPLAPGESEDSVVVRRGDTLKEIADRNHVSVDDLLKANPEIKNRNKINVGQEIKLPAKEKAPEKPKQLPDLPPLTQTKTSQTAEDKLQADARQAELNKLLDSNKTTAAKTDSQKVDEMIGKSDRWDANQMTDQLFFERHPDLKGKKIGKDSAEAKEWGKIKSDIVEPQIKQAVEKNRSEVKTSWNESNLHSDSKDNEAADKIFFERHPDLQGKALKPGSNEAKEWKEIHKEVVQNKYNDTLKEAVKECPGLDPKVLKSLLITESRFEPGVVNKYGYAGIAQFGEKPAKSVGMTVDGSTDDRLDPQKAIPGAAKHLKDKATYLDKEAFTRFGKPTGEDYWKFVTAAYNGGEGTVKKAMEQAYNNGLDEAKKKGLTGDAATDFAKNYATKWDNLLIPKDDIEKSPLYKATSAIFPTIAEEKYNEIGKYPVSIMNRAKQ